MDKDIPVKERRRRKAIRAAKVGVAAIAAVAAVVWLADFSQSSVKMSGLRIGEVDTGTIETTINASGSVKPGVEEIITSPIASRVDSVYKRPGDKVEQGEPLLQLDLTAAQTAYKQMLDEKRMKEYQLEQMRINNESSLRELELRIRVKEMSVNKLAMELRNERHLDSIGSGTGDNVRRAQYAWETEVLELDRLRQNLIDTRAIKEADMNVRLLEMEVFMRKLSDHEKLLTEARILAPRRAVVTYIVAEIGSQIAAGSKVAVVSDLDHYKLDCQISDSYGDRLDVGAQVVIKIGKNLIDGVITDLSPVSQSGVIKFSVMPANDSDPALRSGVRADVYVKTNVIDDAVRIPAGPYYNAGPGDYSLFVVNSDGTALEKRLVKLGQANYEYVEVLSGLNPGEKVVTSDMTPYKKDNTLKIR